MSVLPSTEQLAENIRKHVESLAREIAQRVADDIDTFDQPSARVEHHAKAVLLDWFLGDFIPGAPK